MLWHSSCHLTDIPGDVILFVHIRSNKDFQRVYKNGRSLANRYLVMYVMNNNSDENRIGISVSKKVGNSVIRHRVTRLIRESFRLNKDLFETGYDIVIIARVSAKGKSFNDICSALIHLGKIHNIICD